MSARALVSSPPLAMPPLSWSETVTVDVPFAFAAGVNDSVPPGLIAGPVEKMSGTPASSRKLTV